MATKIFLPRLGESVEEASIGRWVKSVGETVKRGDVIAELETAKAMMELESPVNGVLLAILPELGKTIQMGELVAIVGKAGEDWQKEVSKSDVSLEQPVPEALPKEKITSAEKHSGQRPRISPNAKRVAREQGISLSRILPKQSGERIIARDVLAVAQMQGITPPNGVPFIEIELNTIEKLTAERMQASMKDIPQFSISMEVDAKLILKKVKKLNKDTNYHITLTAVLIETVAKVLKDHPRLNAVYDGGRIVCYQHRNIAFAVATSHGLYVPVIHQADQFDVHTISKRINNLAEACQNRKIKIKDMSGGTFTVSNLGMKGVRQFVPIIDPSQSVILGVGEIYDTIRVSKTGKIKNSKRMILTLACDHRVVDGAGASECLSHLREELERKN